MENFLNFSHAGDCRVFIYMKKKHCRENLHKERRMIAFLWSHSACGIKIKWNLNLRRCNLMMMCGYIQKYFLLHENWFLWKQTGGCQLSCSCYCCAFFYQRAIDASSFTPILMFLFSSTNYSLEACGTVIKWLEIIVISKFEKGQYLKLGCSCWFISKIKLSHPCWFLVCFWLRGVSIGGVLTILWKNSVLHSITALVHAFFSDYHTVDWEY